MDCGSRAPCGLFGHPLRLIKSVHGVVHCMSGVVDCQHLPDDDRSQNKQNIMSHVTCYEKFKENM